MLGATKSTSKLTSHRAGKDCEKRVERLRRAREVEETEAEAEKAVAEVFYGTSRTSQNSNISMVEEEQMGVELMPNEQWRT